MAITFEVLDISQFRGLAVIQAVREWYVPLLASNNAETSPAIDNERCMIRLRTTSDTI